MLAPAGSPVFGPLGGSPAGQHGLSALAVSAASRARAARPRAAIRPVTLSRASHARTCRFAGLRFACGSPAGQHGLGAFAASAASRARASQPCSNLPVRRSSVHVAARQPCSMA
eukprot:10612742-Lingulodinium_polyedra.AAC.1